MIVKLCALQNNETWDIILLPSGTSIVSCM